VFDKSFKSCISPELIHKTKIPPSAFNIQIISLATFEGENQISPSGLKIHFLSKITDSFSFNKKSRVIFVSYFDNI